MAKGTRHLRALEREAAEAQRALESGIVAVDQKWNDEGRRRFEVEHLASIRADARHLQVDLAAIAQAAEQAMQQLQRER